MSTYVSIYVGSYVDSEDRRSRGRRSTEGWQISSILRANSSLPVKVQEGADATDLAARRADRPDYSGTWPGGRDQVIGK